MRCNNPPVSYADSPLYTKGPLYRTAVHPIFNTCSVPAVQAYSTHCRSAARQSPQPQSIYPKEEPNEPNLFPEHDPRGQSPAGAGAAV
nr:MAG TPA: hypothetical protein [Caudoviricetes sp.]